MARVDHFTTVSDLRPGFRIPYQYIGTSETPAPRAIPDSVLLAWIEDNIALPAPATAAETLSTGNTVVIAAGTKIDSIAIEKPASGSRTVKIGTTPGGDEILEETTVDTSDDYTQTVNRYTSSGLTLHFTITGGTVSVLVFKSMKAM